MPGVGSYLLPSWSLQKNFPGPALPLRYPKKNQKSTKVIRDINGINLLRIQIFFRIFQIHATG